MTPLAFLLGACAGALVAAVVMTALRRSADRRHVRRLLDEVAARNPSLVPSASTGVDLAAAIDAVGALLGADDASHAGAEVLRRRLAGALGAIPGGVLVTDTTGQVVFRNAAAAEFHGARHGEALVEAALGELLAAAVSGWPGTRTLELFGPPRRMLVLTATPLTSDMATGGGGESLASDDGGELLGALALVEDITDRRRLEEVRRDFVANLSHELKTPVGALSLLAETLLAEDDPALVERLTRRMTIEAGRVSDTIDDLLLLSRIESEVLPPHERLPVADLVGEAVDRLAPLIEDRDVRVVVDIPGSHGDPSADDSHRSLEVVGDRSQLVSALVNLLDNAVKYTEGDAEVAVRAGIVGGQVHLVVEDHGIGIPTRDVERIFERFYRVDAGRSRRTGGTGLGLSIVRHVAVNHDGEVRVESRLGEGSTFTLCLPLPGPIASVPSSMGDGDP
jgi:two-component system, OmpR family, sensor histidine kinase SenX3